jgi:hypothetical protein
MDNLSREVFMSIKRVLAFGFLSLFLASFLCAQSVAELAQKEKERRAALKGKTAQVVTNSDLAKMNKKLAVDTTVHRGAAIDTPQSPAAATPADAKKAAAAEPTAGAQPAAPAPQNPPPDQATLAEKEYRERMTELTDKASKAQEMIDLLGLKMNTLWQEFYNTNDMKSREYVQFQISETYDKLTKAETDAAKAKKELDDFMATTKKEGTPTIWIK